MVVHQDVAWSGAGLDAISEAVNVGVRQYRALLPGKGILGEGAHALLREHCLLPQHTQLERQSGLNCGSWNPVKSPVEHGWGCLLCLGKQTETCFGLVVVPFAA